MSRHGQPTPAPDLSQPSTLRCLPESFGIMRRAGSTPPPGAKQLRLHHQRLALVCYSSTPLQEGLGKPPRPHTTATSDGRGSFAASLYNGWERLHPNPTSPPCFLESNSPPRDNNHLHHRIPDSWPLQTSTPPATQALEDDAQASSE